MEWFDEIDRKLPPVRTEDFRNECDYYGASDEIARSLGLAHTPVSWAVWSHGWSCQPVCSFQSYVWNARPERKVILVFREDEKPLLETNGYSATFAVGAPFLYASAGCVPRRENSLLIMPARSTNYANHDAEEEEYFDHVAACIHPACIRKGDWLRTFQNEGFVASPGPKCGTGTASLACGRCWAPSRT